MTLIKNISTEVKKKVNKCRQGVITVGLKELTIVNYLPKLERTEELDTILNNPTLLKKTEGFVIEIQDFDYVTQNCRRFENQQTLEKGIKTPYDKFKEKILLIDNSPEQLYYKCKERNRFLKLNDIPKSLNKIIENGSEDYETNWREIHNKKKGLDIQTWILKTHSSMGADIVMPFVPYISQPSISLLRITHEMNIKLHDAFAMSTKEYDAEPSITFSLNYKVFRDKKFADRLIEMIIEFAELQLKRAKERDFKKASFVFIKIYGINSKLTDCRKYFKKFLSQIEIIRDTYDFNFVFLDCPNLTGQLYLCSGVDIFSERTTGRTKLYSSGSSGYGFGSIYLSEDGYYCNISHDEYVDKFHENDDKPLCKHDYCQKMLKQDITSNNMANYNKESRRIHQLLSRFDDVDEIREAMKGNNLRDITFKIGHSNDASLNYLNPYH